MMDYPRLNRRWLIIAPLLLVPFVVPIPGDLERMRPLRALGVAAHFGLPMLLTGLLHAVGPLKGRPRAAALAAFLLTASCEIPQFFVGRHPRLQDAGVDLAGATAALGALRSWAGGPRRWLAVTMLALAIIPVQLRDWPALVRGEALARARFPLLADFEDDRELPLWSANRDSDVSFGFPERPEGGRMLEFRGKPDNCWPGIRQALEPRDWSGYRMLVFEARTTEGEVELRVRLADFSSPRDSVYCHASFSLDETWRRCEIDLTAAAAAAGVESRTFRLDDMDSLLLFLGSVSCTTTVQVDNISLE